MTKTEIVRILTGFLFFALINACANNRHSEVRVDGNKEWYREVYSGNGKVIYEYRKD